MVPVVEVSSLLVTMQTTSDCFVKSHWANEMTYSVAIDEAVSLSESEGNAMREISTGWTKVREVVHMSGPLADSVKSRLAADSRLRYWATQRTPHNQAEEGFTDDVEKVSISFPK